MTKSYMNKMKRITTLLLVAVALVYSACNPVRKSMRAPLKETGVEFLLEKLKQNEIEFKTFSGKADVEFKDKNHAYNLKINYKIVKDSVVWISVVPLLGIEVSRLMLTPDSVKYIDRLNSKYFVGNYDYLNSLFGVNFDFDIIQSLIIANDLGRYDNEQFMARVDKEQYYLYNYNRRLYRKFIKNHSDSTRILLQDMWLNNDNYKITRFRLRESLRQNAAIEVNYSHFKPINSFLFPCSYDINVKSDDEFSVKLEVQRVELDVPLNIQFKIPQKYTAIQLNSKD